MPGLFPLLGQVAMVAIETIYLLWVVIAGARIRSSLLAVFIVASLLVGVHTTVGVLFYSAVVLVAWWALSYVPKPPWLHGSFDRLVASRWRPIWRRYRVYGRKWQEHLQGAGLTKPLKRRPDLVPRLKRVEIAEGRDTLWVELIAGHTPQRWRDSTEALRKSWEARRVRVYDEAGNMIRVVVSYGPDPLAEIRPHPGIPDDPASVDLTAIPIGVTENGDLLTVPVLGSHMLVAGIMGAGKSAAMWSVILGLAPLIREGRVRLWGWDGKGGMELAWGEDLFYRMTYSADPEDWAAQLAELATVMDDKTARYRKVVRKLDPTVEEPLDIAIIDEFARLTRKHADSKLTAMFDRLIGDLVNVGRAPGVSLCGFLQNPTLDTMKHRNEFPWRAALKLDGEGRTDLILGPGAEALGARCGEISHSQPGVGYRRTDKEAEPVMFRLYLVTDEMIADCNARYAPQPAPASA